MSGEQTSSDTRSIAMPVERGLTTHRDLFGAAYGREGA